MPFWFDGTDFSASEIFVDSNSPFREHTIPSSMQNLTASMQKYFDRKSRAHSPSPNRSNKTWNSSPPNLNVHDKDIMRVFLKIFRKHIPKTFSLFKNTTPAQNGQATLTLAMAATGGLFCSVLGSAEVAKSLYRDARRLLLAQVHLKSHQKSLD